MKYHPVHFTKGETDIQRGSEPPPDHTHSRITEKLAWDPEPNTPFTLRSVVGGSPSFPQTKRKHSASSNICWWYFHEPGSWRALGKAFRVASTRAHLSLRSTCTVGMLRPGKMWALPLKLQGTKTYRTYLGLPHPLPNFFPKEK